jgi:hypothetical protein
MGEKTDHSILYSLIVVEKVRSYRTGFVMGFIAAMVVSTIICYI